MTETVRPTNAETIRCDLIQLAVLAAMSFGNSELQEHIAEQLRNLGIEQEDLLEWMGWGRRNDSEEYIEDLANRHLGC